MFQQSAIGLYRTGILPEKKFQGYKFVNCCHILVKYGIWYGTEAPKT